MTAWGRCQGVKLAEAVGGAATDETGGNFAGVRIEIVDVADIAVADLLVVIVVDLNERRLCRAVLGVVPAADPNGSAYSGPVGFHL